MVEFIKLICVGYWQLAHCELDIRLSWLHLKTACVSCVVTFSSFSSSLLLFFLPHSPFSPSDEACETVVIWSKFSNGFLKVKNHFVLCFESDVSFYIRQWPSGHDSIFVSSFVKQEAVFKSWCNGSFIFLTRRIFWSCLYESLVTTFPITCTLMVYREMHKSRAPEFCSVAHGICGSSVWNLSRVTFLAPGKFLNPWCTV